MKNRYSYFTDWNILRLYDSKDNRISYWTPLKTQNEFQIPVQN